MADTQFTPTQRTNSRDEMVARFWAKVGPPDENGCRPWLAAKTRGYGVLRVGGKMVKAHAFAWRLTYHGWGWLKEHETEESPAPSETAQGRGQSGGSHPDPHS